METALGSGDKWVSVGSGSLYMPAIEPIRRSPYSSHLSPYQNNLPSLWTIHPFKINRMTDYYSSSDVPCTSYLLIAIAFTFAAYHRPIAQ